MKRFCCLASGSKGNSLYYESQETKILIDAGINYKNLDLRLNQIGASFNLIEAILITHEHSDHIGALDQIMKNHPDISIVCNSDTAKEIIQYCRFRPKFKLFTTGEPFFFKDLVVDPFSIQHDTVDPVGFIIESRGIRFGMCTDLGFVSSLVREKLKRLHYLVIESNHEVEFVHASTRPDVYKERVLSRQGHLSNDECAELLKAISHDGLRTVFLAHLSEECNHPITAMKKIEAALEESEIVLDMRIAYQDKISDVISIRDEKEESFHQRHKLAHN